nr:MAG TPA: hypothetical protein [Caudoviricetes sp.]
MPDGAAALPLLCNLIYSLQSLLSQFKDYYSGFWITKQIIINRVRRLSDLLVAIPPIAV